MTTHPDDTTTVVALYAARHDAEIARSFLEDMGIHAFVVADDVHVVVQNTEGARLIVMQSQAQRAYEALADAGLTSQGTSADLSDFDGEDEDREASMAEYPSDKRPRKTTGKQRAVAATTAAVLVLVLLFYVPWRVPRSDALVWAPLDRPPTTQTTVPQETGGAIMLYEKGTVAAEVLILQVLAIAALGWLSYVLVGAMSEEESRTIAE